MQSDPSQRESWWGEYSLELHRPVTWALGNLRFQVQRREREWQVAHQRLDEELVDWQYDDGAPPLDESEPRQRVVFNATGPLLTIAPRLADRSVVVRPAAPFVVPPGETATLFVSSPIWVRLRVHEAAVDLLELSAQRPSDTWFGPTTGNSGELCYASRTQGRLALDELPRRPHRAITPMLIRNSAETAFTLERVNLPVTYLSLYEGSRGFLWTQELTMRYDGDQSHASIDIGEGAPVQAGEATFVEPPRVVPEGRTLLRAVATLFG